ncbi:MAG: PDZ domain-containing protein [Planctomycetes bacterium]|nr:PDZ domain-containing protein [Planctomycetota bacterium]
MKKLAGFIIVLMLGFGMGMIVNSLYADDGKEEAKPEQEELQVKIKNFIKDLGADESKVRDNATKELKDIGEPAIPFLKEALGSDDPEVVWRSKIILKAIERNKQKAANKEEPQEDDKVQVWPKLPKSSNNIQIIIQGSQPYESFSLSSDQSGRVTVTIKKKDKEGEEKVETYAADSMEEFIKQYPELAEKYGLNKEEKTEIPGMDEDELLEDFGKSWGNEFDRVRKQMEQMDEMMKKMFEGQGLDDWPDLPRLTRPKKSPEEKSEPKLELGMVVSAIEPALKEQLSIKEEGGILVREVKKDSLAEKMGFKQWDLVLKVNDEDINSIWTFRRQMMEKLDKGEVEITVIRKAEKQVLKYKK